METHTDVSIERPGSELREVYESQFAIVSSARTHYYPSRHPIPDNVIIVFRVLERMERAHVQSTRSTPPRTTTLDRMASLTTGEWGVESHHAAVWWGGCTPALPGVLAWPSALWLAAWRHVTVCVPQI